jgi:hypothetical protein
MSALLEIRKHMKLLKCPNHNRASESLDNLQLQRLGHFLRLDTSRHPRLVVSICNEHIASYMVFLIKTCIPRSKRF